MARHPRRVHCQVKLSAYTESLESPFSVFFARAFGNFLSKFQVPYMALPFNLVAVFVFLTLQPPDLQPQEVSTNTTQLTNSTLSWHDVGRGVIVSMGQVYAVSEVEPSIIMNLAVLLSSPLLFVMANIGGALGTLLSLCLIEESEYEDVTNSLRLPLGQIDVFSCTTGYSATTPSSAWPLSPASSSLSPSPPSWPGSSM